MENGLQRSAEVIAQEINIIKSQTAGILEAAFAQANRSCFEIGKRLCEVKELVGHGNWGEWLEKNVNYSESTAQNLMRVYREFGDDQIDMLTGKSPVEVFEKLTFSQMVAMFTLPPQERLAFVEEHNVQEMSSREIQELIRAKNAAEKETRQLLAEREERAEEFKRQEQACASAEIRAAKAEECANRAVSDAESSQKETEKLKKAIKKLKQELAEKDEALSASKAQEPLEQEVQVQTVIRNEPDDATLEQIRRDAAEKAKAEADAELQKALEQMSAKQNPDALELGILFDQLQNVLCSMSAKMKVLKQSNPELGEAFAEKIRKGLDSVLITYFGFGVEK